MAPMVLFIGEKYPVPLNTTSPSAPETSGDLAAKLDNPESFGE
jgi:hypothetical protein